MGPLARARLPVGGAPGVPPPWPWPGARGRDRAAAPPAGCPSHLRARLERGGSRVLGFGRLRAVGGHGVRQDLRASRRGRMKRATAYFSVMRMLFAVR